MPVEIMYFLPNARTRGEMCGHVDLVRKVRELGVGWCTMNGHGRSLADAKRWMLDYRDTVIDPVGAE